MSIQFACPYCDKVSSVPDSFAGKKGKCPNCKKVIEVPDPNADDGGDGGGGGYDSDVSDGGGSSGPMMECRYCGESIKKVAKKCKYCGEFLDKRLKPGGAGGRGGAAARAKARKAEEMPSAAEYILCVLCSGIGCIVAIVYLVQGYTKKGGIMLAISLIMQVIGGIAQVALDSNRGY